MDYSDPRWRLPHLLWTTVKHGLLFWTVQSNQALYTDPHPSLWWAIPDETSLVNWRWHLSSGWWDGWESDLDRMKMRMFPYFVTSGSKADQIFMVITPNESLASEFKFRWDQKEKRFVEVIGGLMIRYEGLINGVVGSYQLIWSPAVTQHMKHLASNI